MKLPKSLREHYRSNDNTTWIPKAGFETEQQIKDQLGFDTSICRIYKCGICELLHVATPREWHKT